MDSSETRNGNPFTPCWTYAAHHAVGVLAVDGGECFVAAKSTRLVALDAATGRERWSSRIDNPWGWIATTRSAVCYLNQHSRLVAFERESGHVRWKRELGGINGWLHAAGEIVVVGGWRGYTDIVGLDGFDGSILWTLPTRGAALHSTRIHALSTSLVIADPAEGGGLVFVDLETGCERARIDVPGAWVNETCERPRGSHDANEPCVLYGGDDELIVVDGEVPSVRRVTLPPGVWSRNLECTENLVPFVTSSRQLAVVSLRGEQRSHELGPIEHNRRDLLPFCRVSDRGFVVGTSFGELMLYSRDGSRHAKQSVGKRVSTRLASVGNVIVFGTGSGEVLGVKVHQPG